MEDKIINKILNPENMHQAKLKVISNKGASGIDGISVEEIDEYIKNNWARIRQEIIEKTLQTTTSSPSRNSKTKRRKTKTRNTNSNGQNNPTSNRTSTNPDNRQKIF
ncbi:hypothetical protein [Anaerococcus sp. Marseille-P9784]|uniref:hypothetical protein n=1 Tax=Anaerococcus sp. Marseille-P9784 TaxID=2614127 RepID=UPI001CEDC9A5|nr:hypothetical protein [Anaerococcus sp. Marseille-P9784]